MLYGVGLILSQKHAGHFNDICTPIYCQHEESVSGACLTGYQISRMVALVIGNQISSFRGSIQVSLACHDHKILPAGNRIVWRLTMPAILHLDT